MSAVHGLGNPVQPQNQAVHNWKSMTAKVAAIALPILLVAGVITAMTFLPAALGITGVGAFFAWTAFSITLGMGAWYTAPKVYDYFNNWSEQLKTRPGQPPAPPTGQFFRGQPRRLPAAPVVAQQPPAPRVAAAAAQQPPAPASVHSTPSNQAAAARAAAALARMNGQAPADQ